MSLFFFHFSFSFGFIFNPAFQFCPSQSTIISSSSIVSLFLSLCVSFSLLYISSHSFSSFDSNSSTFIIINIPFLPLFSIFLYLCLPSVRFFLYHYICTSTLFASLWFFFLRIFMFLSFFLFCYSFTTSSNFSTTNFILLDYFLVSLCSVSSSSSSLCNVFSFFFYSCDFLHSSFSVARPHYFTSFSFITINCFLLPFLNFRFQATSTALHTQASLAFRMKYESGSIVITNYLKQSLS